MGFEPWISCFTDSRSNQLRYQFRKYENMTLIGIICNNPSVPMTSELGHLLSSMYAALQ